MLLRCKICVLGDSKVGKTALVRMFDSDGIQFPKNYQMTDGYELSQRTVHIPDSECDVELFVMDISGHPIHHDLVPSLIQQFNAFVLVYDMTSLSSFDNLSKWVTFLYNERSDLQTVPGVLVGNKSDLANRICVSIDEADAFAQKHGLQHFLCSAESGEDVDSPFNFIAAAFNRMYQEHLKDTHSKI